MGSKLTARETAFVSAKSEGMTNSNAYRESYSTKGMQEKTIWEEASRVAARPKVSARLFELQEQAAERTLVTVESLTAELNEARVIANDQDDASELRQNTMAKAKLHGLDVHKVESKETLTIKLAKDVDDL